MAVCACEQPPVAPATTCRISPPDGPFDAPLADAPRPAAQRELPTNPDASTFLISPAPRHRWSSKVGLVETRDGSVLLHGVGRVPGEGPTELSLTVLVGYESVDARLRVWTPDRRRRLADARGTHVLVPLDEPAVAFDVELPAGTVRGGHWQEVQTIATLGAASPDVRRWTVYGGPKGPTDVPCARGDAAKGPTARASFGEDGNFELHAPRVATLAVVPIDRTRGPSGGRHILKLGRNDGWRAHLEPAVTTVAVFEGPFGGPGKDWISNFWSATRAKAVSTSKLR